MRSSSSRNPAAMVASSDAREALEVLVLPAGVQRRQGGVVEGLGPAEQHGEGLAGLPEAAHDRGRHVDPRRADPALGDAVLVEDVARPVAVELERGRRRRSLAAGRPPGPGAPARPGPRSAAAGPALIGVSVWPIMRSRRGAQQLGHALGGQRAVVVPARTDRVRVGVRRARHLPHPQAVGVGLFRQAVHPTGPRRSRSASTSTGTRASSRMRSPLDEMATRVASMPSRCDAGMNTPSIETPDAGRPCTKNPSKSCGVRIDGVDVGHQAGGRLRLARRQDLRRRQPAQRVLVARQLQQPADLGEDVEGPGVAGMLERRRSAPAPAA